jgi:riboflavin kinase / FMN adenylyltransferase
VSDPAVLTVGTFDGIHRGHAAVIETLVHEARLRRQRSVVVTFDPHPLVIVQPDRAPQLLTTPDEKRTLLAGVGVDEIAILRFDRAMADLSPRRFVEDVLMPRFGLRHLVIGYDHGFGRGRSGDASVLAEIGRGLGFSVQVVPPLLLEGVPISASRIRAAIRAGDVESAAHALGRPYSLRGTVQKGDGRGRELGFPTANLLLDDPLKLLPADGIYAVRTVIDGAARDALLHLGPRPTFDSAAVTMEVYVLDFDADLYGRSLEVSFCARIRGVEHFGSADALVRAMTADRDAAIALFADGGGACRQG